MHTGEGSGVRPGYRQLLARHGTPVFILASLAARLPVVMVSLALILAVSHAYSPGIGGACAGAMTLGNALAGPQRGRLADHLGPRRVLLTSAAGYTLALGTAIAAVHWRAGAPVPALMACCAAAGACTPPAAPVMRTAWRRHLAAAPELLHAAQTWESTAIDVTYVAGPAIVAILASAVSALSALTVAAAGVIAGCAALAATRPIRAAGPGSERTRGYLRPWHIPGLVPLLAVAATTTAAITATELATIHAARLNGNPAAAGWLIAALSAGSIVTGLGYGAHRPPGSSHAHLAACCGIWLIAQLACAALPPLYSIAGLLAIAGTGLAPGITAQYAIAADLAPARAQTETFAWLNSTGQLGSTAAAVATGWLPAAGGYLLSAALAAAALITTVAASRFSIRLPIGKSDEKAR